MRENRDFDFLLLGDLHFDRLEHHDHEWLKREKPNDVRQVENYSRITREVVPSLFAELKGQAREKKPAFLCHIGDFVEGLAGTPELARRHCQEAVEFVEKVDLGVPFLFCKGNHDVTGPGAVEAFNDVLQSFIARQAREKVSSFFTRRQGDCLFVYFDAYDRPADHLDWLERTLATRPAEIRQVFFVVHPPLIPYGARSNWHLFAKPSEAGLRERLLNMLGAARAIVLCGHLHKYGTVVRQTPKGPLVQVAVASVVPEAGIKPRDEVSGLGEYGPDLVRLEPNFSPTNEGERRDLLAREKPFIRYYDYADAPGYGVVSVRGEKVQLELYVGLGRRKFRTLDLTALLKKGE
jgi:3',5'-cyclic AMP phosphodiesterase CpdA